MSKPPRTMSKLIALVFDDQAFGAGIDGCLECFGGIFRIEAPPCRSGLGTLAFRHFADRGLVNGTRGGCDYRWDKDD